MIECGTNVPFDMVIISNDLLRCEKEKKLKTDEERKQDIFKYHRRACVYICKSLMLG